MLSPPPETASPRHGAASNGPNVRMIAANSAAPIGGGPVPPSSAAAGTQSDRARRLADVGSGGREFGLELAQRLASRLFLVQVDE